jgi:chorismate dehydratase
MSLNYNIDSLNYKILETEDGTTSYWNEEFQEAYHSKVGAYREALEKHVQACNITELAQKSNQIDILDLCFGLGYNTLVAIDEARKVNPEIKINIIALENDFEILKKIGQLSVPQSISDLRDSINQVNSINDPEMLFVYPCYNLEGKNFNLSIIMGDASCSIDLLEDDSFDAVFFDPFSPKVCPELWQASFIKSVVDKAKPGALISTYSSSRLAKDGFLASNCTIQEGPLCGRRTGGVLAKKSS